jgi:hypothetical protein
LFELENKFTTMKENAMSTTIEQKNKRPSMREGK